MTKYAISRLINGITLNGDEYLLDESNEVKLFNGKVEAIDFLKSHGFNDEDIASFSIEEYKH